MGLLQYFLKGVIKASASEDINSAVKAAEDVPDLVSKLVGMGIRKLLEAEN
jgi:hypothetical protein